MGRLVDGRWHTGELTTASARGEFVRAASAFRDWIDGTEGIPEGAARLPAVGGRYRLYVAWACPWAHRTLLVRALYGLEDALPVGVVAPEMLGFGWAFDAEHPDPFYGHAYLRDVYTHSEPRCTSKVTVPVLFDAERERIVSNESSEIIRMLAGPLARAAGSAAAPFAGFDLRPQALRAEIDAWNDRIYETVNNGVYRCGFARSQEAYDDALHALFDTLDALEARLSTQRWIVGNTFTEADLRLFPTLYRFVPVYQGHFKCSLRDLRADYPALWAWVRDVYQLPKVASTVNLEETRRHYYYSHDSVNPHRIVPPGPSPSYDAPHDRARLGPTPGRAVSG